MTTMPTTDPTLSPIPTPELDAARRLLAALVEHARTEGEQARAEVALAHLDDVWPLPRPADAVGITVRGTVLVDEAIGAVVEVVATAGEAQGRARALRALEVITSVLDMPGREP